VLKKQFIKEECEMNNLIKRNHLIDAMKAIAALGVIFVHFQFPGVIGKICAAFGTVGVIFFFLISGYQTYCEDARDSVKILRRFKRNLLLVSVVLLVYLVYTVIEHVVMGTILSWAQTKLLDPVTYLRMFVLGDLDFINCGHLWYMVAMLYGYLILYCMEKYRLHKIFYIALPLLLLLRVSMETYTNSFSHFSWFDWHFSGNFLVGALPIMVLGNYICRKEEKLLKPGAKAFIPCATVLMLLVFLTVNVKILGMDCSQLFKIAAATAFFMLCLAMPLDKPVFALSYVGRSLSLYIYIWHLLIGALIQDLLTCVNAAQWAFDWCLPIAAIVATIAVSWLMAKISARTKATAS
jgi:surface polysaccharide O-acyltransferase-like enzyme